MHLPGGEVALAELDHPSALGGIHDRFPVRKPEAVILIRRVGGDSGLDFALQVQDPEVVGRGIRLLFGEENSSTVGIEADPCIACGFTQSLGMAGSIEQGQVLSGCGASPKRECSAPRGPEVGKPIAQFIGDRIGDRKRLAGESAASNVEALGE